MVQESTMICFDNSDWMRNGDFSPSRLQCQQDAASLIAHCKIRANPENAVGVLSMADTVEVLSTLTQETNKINSKVYQIQPKGQSNFINGIKIAHLALKHRQNRNHKMRIILFVGSPIEHLDMQELLRLSKKLKKEKVLADVVCFGEADGENSALMQQFVESLNGRDGSGSNLVVVSPGSTLTEALASSPVCRGEDGAIAPVVPPGGGGFGFGIDSENDPDLALAIRVSLEEQRQRQQQEATATGTTSTAEVQGDTSQNLMDMDPGAMTEEQQLEWALRLSLQDGAGGQSVDPSTVASTTGAPATSTAQEDEKMDVTSAETEESKGNEDDQLGQLMNDPELLRQLVADLPGVDPDSQEIQDAISKSSTEKKGSKKEDGHSKH